MAEELRTARQDHVETWTLNRPDERNPISRPETVDALVELLVAVNGDQDVRVVILTGEGSAFSAGGNVKDMVDKVGLFGGSPAELRSGYLHGIQRIARAMYDCEVPIVAAVNGPAVGAGCDLALMCDLRVAASTAFFAESFVKLGLIPGDGGAWFLSAVVGQERAAEMILTGDRVDAATALSWGMVSRVVAPEALLDEAHDLASRIAVNPPQAVKMAKRLLRESRHQTLSGVLELSASMQALAHQTRDHGEALTAFTEKRAGAYGGY